MRDVQDFHKYVDMLSKSVSRRAPQGQPAPEQAEQEVSPAVQDTSAMSPHNGQAKRLPPRSGRGPRTVETREQLLRRLLDPTLTLDETARILEVCPTTVRRYTDRTHSPLPCQRSAGNQRRFRLSEVLAFKEGQIVAASEAGE